MRRAGALLVALAVLGACTAPPPQISRTPTPPPSREPGTVAVTALLDLSGPRGPKGEVQRDALQRWVDAQRTSPRVRLRIVDLAGSEARLILELKRSAEAADSDAFVVGVPVALDDALSEAIALVARPVLFTLPLATPSGPGARWMFALAPPARAVARAVVGTLPPDAPAAVIVVLPGLTAGREELALVAALAAAGRPAPAILRIANAADREAVAQRLARGADDRAPVFVAGATADALANPRLLPSDGGPGGPVYASYLTEPGDAGRFGAGTARIRWPGSRAATLAGLATHAATASDAIALLAAALDPAGDAERSRARIEGGTFAGIVGRYAFSAAEHAGADPADLALLAWEGGRALLGRPVATPSPSPTASPAATR